MKRCSFAFYNLAPAGDPMRGEAKVARELTAISSFINPVKYEICAKGVTAAGNRRTGSGCNINANVRHSCFDGINPYSAAYVYWAGGGSPTSIAGDARTPSSVNWC